VHFNLYYMPLEFILFSGVLSRSWLYSCICKFLKSLIQIYVHVYKHCHRATAHLQLNILYIMLYGVGSSKGYIQVDIF
jgi:hypothetical protein